MSELRSRVGLSSSALSQRVPEGEVVRDLVVSAGYAVLGRWRERYEDIDYEQAIDMLESVGAEHLAERTYETLSEGERKRVLIARSLMTDPELLLLDEPAAGLDLGGREELVARLEDLAADPDAPAIVLVTHHVEEIPRGFSHALILSEGRVVDAGLLTDVLTAGEPVEGVRPVHRPRSHRRPLLRPAHQKPGRAQEAMMAEDPLVPRPAATVMLVRDTPDGIKVFLMRRHRKMDFVGGVMVFPGGGVDDRDRNADIAWHGPDKDWWGERLGTDADLAEALVCAAARETFEECGVLFAGAADDPDLLVDDASSYRDSAGRAGEQGAVLRRVPARREADAARRPAAPVGELGDAQGGAHPPLRHLFLRRCASGRAARRRREHRIRPGRLDHARSRPRRTSRRSAASCCRRRGPSSTRWPAAPSPRCSPSNAGSSPISPNMSMTDGNLEFEFFDGERYNQALGGPHPVREFVSIHTLDEQPGIATLLLSRPPTNALTRQVCREIISAAAELGARDDIAAVIVFGGHEIFCAGDDVTVLRDPRMRRRPPGPREVGREAVDAIAAIPKPTVAAITGYALGSGLTLALGRGLAGGGRQHQGRRDRDPVGLCAR